MEAVEAARSGDKESENGKEENDDESATDDRRRRKRRARDPSDEQNRSPAKKRKINHAKHKKKRNSLTEREIARCIKCPNGTVVQLRGSPSKRDAGLLRCIACRFFMAQRAAVYKCSCHNCDYVLCVRCYICLYNGYPSNQNTRTQRTFMNRLNWESQNRAYCKENGFAIWSPACYASLELIQQEMGDDAALEIEEMIQSRNVIPAPYVQYLKVDRESNDGDDAVNDPLENEEAQRENKKWTDFMRQRSIHEVQLPGPEPYLQKTLALNMDEPKFEIKVNEIYYVRLKKEEDDDAATDEKRECIWYEISDFKSITADDFSVRPPFKMLFRWEGDAIPMKDMSVHTMEIFVNDQWISLWNCKMRMGVIIAKHGEQVDISEDLFSVTGSRNSSEVTKAPSEGVFILCFCECF